MKTAPFVVLLLFLVAPLRAQDGTDAKAKLPQALAAAQKAYDSGNFEEAEAQLKGVASAAHDDFKAVLLRAKANFELAEFGKASTYADRAAELDANNLEARLLAGRSKYQQAEVLKASPLNSGTRVSGFYEGALTDFDKALKLKPDDKDLLGWKAQTLFWLDRVPESIKIYEDLRKARPDDPEICLRIAQFHQLVKNDDAALKAATEGLATKGAPGSLVRGDLATVLWGILGPQGKHAELFAAYKAWNAAHPSDALSYLWMGYTRATEKNFDEAITHYQKGFEASGKKHAGLALELGNSFVQKADLPKAAEWFGTASKLQPEWPNYLASPVWKLNEVSRTYAERLDYPKATETLEKNALPAGLNDRFTMNNLGLYYRDWADKIDRSHKNPDAKAKNEKSLDYYLKASKLVVADETATPTEKAQVLNDTGVIYHHQMGNVEKGVELYRQALQNDPQYKDALENLALCFNALGKYEEAIPLFEKVLQQEGGRIVARRGLSEAKKAVEKDQKPTSR